MGSRGETGALHQPSDTMAQTRALVEHRASIIVVSSHVARGTVGNRAAAHAIEALGHPVWSVPTVLLPWHPGQGAGTRVRWPEGAFASLLDDLAASERLSEVGALLSGYLGGPDQPAAISHLVAGAKVKRDAIYCCDPVIGNERGRYVDRAIAEGIRDGLVPIAGIATPNRFELAWLLGRSVPETPTEVARLAAKLGPPTVLVTSATVADDTIGTVLVHGDLVLIASHRRINAPNAGTGDLVAALFLARTLEGEEPADALRLALSGAAEAVAAEAAIGADELPLERIHERLREPRFPVTVERLDVPLAGPRGAA